HAFAGRLELLADGSFSGTGVGSDEASVEIRGAAGEFQAFPDGRFVAEVVYDPAGSPDYERAFRCGGTPRMVFGVDTNGGGNDASSGLFALMRQRTEPYAAADLEGSYRLGLFTVFPNPNAS